MFICMSVTPPCASLLSDFTGQQAWCYCSKLLALTETLRPSKAQFSQHFSFHSCPCRRGSHKHGAGHISGSIWSDGWASHLALPYVHFFCGCWLVTSYFWRLSPHSQQRGTSIGVAAFFWLSDVKWKAQDNLPSCFLCTPENINKLMLVYQF